MGDVRDPDVVEQVLERVDAVIHLAAKVGVGQSMYEIAEYTGVNDLGTAVLLQALSRLPVRKLVVASSMSIYGEGLMVAADGTERDDMVRSPDALRCGQWDPRERSGGPLQPVPTPERKRPGLHSLYALGKFAQERMCLVVGPAYGMGVVALRLFNVYGPRQALSNPYTGVIAIFVSRMLNGQSPLVFEDGRQRRDFVHVGDVAAAFRLALERDAADGLAVNVGSGTSVTIREVAERLAAAMCSTLRPHVTGRYRVGDIRHCFADIGSARRLLGYTPKTRFDEGLAELVGWLAGQHAVDRSQHAWDELARRGLVA